jgi:DNA-binding HxlR family transcriptional regulator
MELAREVRKVDTDLAEGVLSKDLKRLAGAGLVRQEPIDKHRHVWNLTPRGRRVAVILSQITDLDHDNDESPPDEQNPDDDDES